MEQEFLERIEEAALNAWPAPRQMVYDGWLLRFAEGYTKRSNSVNVRYPSNLPLNEKIAYCEQIYAMAGLPLIFRLPEPFTSDELCDALQEAGYSTFDPTLVLGRKIAMADAPPANLETRLLSPEGWLRLRAQLTGTPLSTCQVHARILKVIVPQKALLGVYQDGAPVACGMGVVEGALLGYFSIFTAASERRRGYGQAVMQALSAWGADHGAAYGYLQVEGDNEPARAMYGRSGFERCYAYSYSRKDA